MLSKYRGSVGVAAWRQLVLSTSAAVRKRGGNGKTKPGLVPAAAAEPAAVAAVAGSAAAIGAANAVLTAGSTDAPRLRDDED